VAVMRLPSTPKMNRTYCAKERIDTYNIALFGNLTLVCCYHRPSKRFHMMRQRENQQLQDSSVIIFNYHAATIGFRGECHVVYQRRRRSNLEDKKNAFDFVAESDYGTETHAGNATTKS
jgi:hypothetical protein